MEYFVSECDSMFNSFTIKYVTAYKEHISEQSLTTTVITEIHIIINSMKKSNL